MRLERDPMQNITVGMTAERDYVFTSERLVLFADLIGDHAPVHFDQDFARESGFSDRIVHGFFISAIFSSLLGNHLPGELSVINQVTVKLHRAVVIGDRLIYRVVVSQVSPATRAVVLELSASGPQGEVILSGKAICSLPLRK